MPKAAQTSMLFDQPSATEEDQKIITINARGPLEEAASRLAVMVYIGAESFGHVCGKGELDFIEWEHRVKKQLANQHIEASDEEMEWLREHLPYEPRLKARIGKARKLLNARLRREPALPAQHIIALFMKGNIAEDERTLPSSDVGVPTALIALEEPLHFVCHRGAIFQFHTSPVRVQMNLSELSSKKLGTPAEERERFVLGSEKDLIVNGDRVVLKYPSLNKAFPGIFNRLHLGQGKQITGRSIYYHAAWVTCDSQGRTEYRSLWSIRDDVLKRTWKCPPSPTPEGQAQIP